MFTSEIVTKESQAITAIKEKNAAARRIPELDGLRGIAILLVITFHYINNQLTNSTAKIGRALCQVTSFGWTGVDLFFVLSGFLIGTILIRNRQSPRYFSTFYIRRIVRIIPNYYLLIGLFLLLLGMPYFSRSAFLHKGNDIPWWSYLAMVHNIYMGRLHSLGSNAVNVTWSIGIEEQFYLVFPLIVYFAKKEWIPYILGLAILLASVIRGFYAHWIPRYVFLPCRMDSIAFGAMVAYFNEGFQLEKIVKKYAGWFALILMADVGTCLYLFLRYSDLGINRHFFLAVFFSGCLVAALVYQDSFYGRLLRNRLLTWIGTISYSLYLFHYLILALLQYSLLNYEGGVLLSNSRDAGVSVLAMGISVLFAWFVFKKLETPFVNYGKRFKY